MSGWRHWRVAVLRSHPYDFARKVSGILDLANVQPAATKTRVRVSYGNVLNESR
jgi:hypothetical protein